MRRYEHHAILVTAPTFLEAQRVASVAERIFAFHVSPIGGQTSGFYTVVIPPDGGCEGSTVSNDGDANRARFRAYLARNTILHWVEVVYGLDGASITASASMHGGEAGGSACG